MADKEPTVNTPSGAYLDMEQHFTLMNALKGGTLAMRAQGRTYLPQQAKESNDRWTLRKDAAVLLEAYGDALATLSHKPFGERVNMKEPNALHEEIAEDVDLSGTDLTSFSRECLEDLIHFGKCHILVDHPNTHDLAEQIGRQLTLADTRVNNVRPYFIRLPGDMVIGWRGERIQGIETLTRMRYRQTTIEPHGAYGEKDQLRVIEWFPEGIVEHIKTTDDNNNEAFEAGGPMTNTLGKIPLVTIYANRQGLLHSYPVLEGLGHLNAKHWRNASDQDGIETVNRVPLLYLQGFQENEVGSVVVGPYKAIHNRNPQADVKIVETTGGAVKVGQDGLDRLERHMQAMTMAPLIRRPGNPTATELTIEDGRQVSDLEAYVMLLEVGINQAFMLADEWQGVAEPDSPDVAISQDFGPLPNARDLEELREDFKLGAISQKTYLWERQRRGLYSEDMDIETEIASMEDAEGDATDGAEFEQEDEENREAA